MSRFTRISVLVLLLLMASGALVMQFVRVPQEAVIQPTYTANSGELTGTALVGQTFVAPRDDLSGIAVQFATYSERKNTHPVELHLRMWPAGSEDIRLVKVSPEQLADNRLYNFSFDPIPDSAGKTFFFYLVSPQSVDGNAVTVDISTHDPYPSGSAFLAHASPVELSNPEVVSHSGKPSADVTFTLYHQVPLRIALLNNSQQFLKTFFDVLWLRSLLMAVALLIVFILLNKNIFTLLQKYSSQQHLIIIFLIILFAAAVGFRLLYAHSLPFTSDEGGYLYDARVLRTGHLAGGDGYVKSPLVIVWVMIWQLIFGDTLFAGRFSSVLISALILFPLYGLGRALWNERVGLTIGAIWALCGSAIISGIYVHTQPVALFFGVTGLYFIMTALRATRPAPEVRKLLFWGGVFLGLGVASRKSILALGLVPLVACLIYGKSWREKLKYLFFIGTGFLIVIAAFLVFAFSIYHTVGITEAIGINSAEDGITATDPSQLEQVQAYSLHGMTPFFRESLPLILLTTVGLGLTLERALRSMARFKKTKPSPVTLFILDQILPKISWLAAFGTLWWAWSFFLQYEGSAFMRFGILGLWYAMAAVLSIGTVIPRTWKERLYFETIDTSLHSNQPGFVSPLGAPKNEEFSASYWFKRDFLAAAIIPLWVGGLAFFYIHWIKFHANYISEFIPPLVVLSGFGLYTVYRRLSELPAAVRWLGYIFIAAVVVYAATVSNYITYLYEHTGQFDQKASEQAAQWAKDHIPAEQTIFTGAALIPYLSGHRVTLDIAHPRWYAYEFTRKDPHRLNTFLPPAEDMVKAFRNTQWFLMDQQTGFSFIQEYSEIEKALSSDFAAQTTIDNGGNPLTFYRRIHAQ